MEAGAEIGHHIVLIIIQPSHEQQQKGVQVDHQIRALAVRRWRPFAGFSPSLSMAYIHQDGGEEALSELLDMFSGPTPEFIDDILMATFGTTGEHDRAQMRENILPAIVADFPAIANQLEHLGLLEAANIVKAKIAIQGMSLGSVLLSQQFAGLTIDEMEPRA